MFVIFKSTFNEKDAIYVTSSKNNAEYLIDQYQYWLGEIKRIFSQFKFVGQDDIDNLKQLRTTNWEEELEWNRTILEKELDLKIYRELTQKHFLNSIIKYHLEIELPKINIDDITNDITTLWYEQIIFVP